MSVAGAGFAEEESTDGCDFAERKSTGWGFAQRRRGRWWSTRVVGATGRCGEALTTTAEEEDVGEETAALAGAIDNGGCG
ncbi:hypothetical protein GW17_00044860 [Ensete ventricosum]|nr:hypothetical protein GW17_00044860 [Ensete ventricosum]